MPAPVPPRLELTGITKAYPTVVANDGISLAVAAGEIHALLGENGAGKSTLMKIVYGVVRPDSGTMHWNGVPVEVTNPAAARRLGIGMVFQHFSLFETLTVAENISLALEKTTDLASLSDHIREVSNRYGLPLEPGRHVHTMSVGERQRVEIVRCLLQSPKLLILDEPTSVLTPQAAEALFRTLELLAAEGVSILYISHKLDEIRRLCQAATVLRGGRVVGAADPRAASVDQLATMMIGGALPHARHRRDAAAGGAQRLVVENLTLPTDDPFGTSLDRIALTVRSGEIVGIAGVSGNGQQELLAALSGEHPVPDPRTIRFDDLPVGTLDAARRRDLGLAFVPEERLGRGAVPEMTLNQNALLTGHRQGMVSRGFVQPKAVEAYSKRVIAQFDVRAGGPQAVARSLSGGNLQKFIVGREILQSPRLMIVAQPTWGVDVGAAAVIRQSLVDLRDAGVAVLVVSEELDELFEVSDRIAVMYGGRLSPLVAASATTVEEIGRWMGGAMPEAVAGEHDAHPA